MKKKATRTWLAQRSPAISCRRRACRTLKSTPSASTALKDRERSTVSQRGGALLPRRVQPHACGAGEPGRRWRLEGEDGGVEAEGVAGGREVVADGHAHL